MTTFARVKEIFNTAMKNWRTAPENDPDKDIDLVKRHREATFPKLDGDFTADDLKNGMARTLPLIQPGVAGKDTNLVRALRGQLANTRVMPGGGPVIPASQIDEIVQWIDAGSPSA